MRSPTRFAWCARLLGVIVATGAATVVQFPSSPSHVTASAIGSNGQGTLLFIGDSLTVGSAAFGDLKERIEATDIWTKVIIDAKVGRKASEAVAVLKKSAGRRTTAVVIALGVNDMISRREPWYPTWVITKVMKQTGDRPVLWINPKFSATGRRDWIFRATRFARALRTAQRTWPNLSIADWNSTFVPRGASRFIADGVHLTVSGYRTRATFCVRSVSDFGTTIVNSTSTTTSTTSTTTTTSVPETTSTTTSSTSTTTLPLG